MLLFKNKTRDISAKAVVEMSMDQLTCEAGNVKATESCPHKASSYSNITSIAGKSGRRTDTGSGQPSSRHFHQLPGRDVSEG